MDILIINFFIYKEQVIDETVLANEMPDVLNKNLAKFVVDLRMRAMKLRVYEGLSLIDEKYEKYFKDLNIEKKLRIFHIILLVTWLESYKE
jgi:hypothetical protein